MEEEQLLKIFVLYINNFFHNYNENSFSKNKDESIEEMIIFNKTGIQLFLENLKNLKKYLCISTYNMDLDGLSKIERQPDNQLRIYADRLFHNDIEKSVFFAPEKMHLIQEDSDMSKTTAAIVTKGHTPGKEILYFNDKSEVLYVEGRNVILIHPFCSHYAAEEEKIRLIQNHFKLNITEDSLIQMPKLEELYSLEHTVIPEHTTPEGTSLIKTKKITLNDHLVQYFDNDFSIPLPKNNIINIVLDLNEKEANIEKAVTKLEEIYPNSIVHYYKKQDNLIIEIAKY